MTGFSIGNPGTSNNPAITIGNATDPGVSGWTILATVDPDGMSGTTGVAGVTGTVLAVGNQAATGTLSASILAVDSAGDLGLAGSVTIGGSASAQIQAAYDPPPTGTSAPFGSLYLRSDSASTGPRLFEYQSLPSGAPSDWLEIPIGLGIFNVKDYGAVGQFVSDDTEAIQAAIDAAENHIIGGTVAAASGAIVYFPPGQYSIYTPAASATSPLTINGVSNLTLCGVGSASQVLPAADMDVFYAPSGGNGLAIRDMQILYSPVGSAPPVGLSGAGIHLVGSGGDCLIENVDTNTNNNPLGLGLFANTSSGVVRIINCTLGGNLAGAYVSCGAEIHHSHLNGTTYGLICDGVPGVKMTNVALFGALSLAVWNTTSGGLRPNNVYAYDVEANYADPYKGGGNNLETTSGVPLSGIGTYYPAIYTGAGVQPQFVDWPVYIRDGSGNQLAGTVSSYISSGAFAMTSNLESGTMVAAGASAWIPAPWYPSQIGGEGVGSASLVATSSDVHLADCWLQDITTIGGTPPVTHTSLTSSLALTGAPTGTYTIAVQSNEGFLTGSAIYVCGPTSSSGQAYAVGEISALSSTTGITFTSTFETAAPLTGIVASGFVSQAFSAGLPFFPAPPEPANAYPFVPQNVTVQGGSQADQGPNHYLPSEQLGNAAIVVAQAKAATISDCDIATTPMSSGYGIYIGPDVGSASIVGNNITTLGTSAAVMIGPSANVNCQKNLCLLPTHGPSVGPSGLIHWPSAVTQPFTVARNPGYNPAGLLRVLIAAGAGGNFTATNTWGVPGTFYVAPPASGVTIEQISYAPDGHTYRVTGLTKGAISVEPGASIEITWMPTTAPSGGTITFIGD